MGNARWDQAGDVFLHNCRLLGRKALAVISSQESLQDISGAGFPPSDHNKVLYSCTLTVT